MNDDRIYTGAQAQEKLKIDDKKLAALADHFAGIIDGFADYVGKWRKYTKREIEFLRYFLREKSEFDLDAFIAKDAINMFYGKK